MSGLVMLLGASRTVLAPIGSPSPALAARASLVAGSFIFAPARPLGPGVARDGGASVGAGAGGGGCGTKAARAAGRAAAAPGAWPSPLVQGSVAPREQLWSSAAASSAAASSAAASSGPLTTCDASGAHES
eukprot:CAMPEP_0115297080 /NCGR_PEP_ID=MMETSP0270-20121206/67567_1 /TAXON_ID=71861 /ORGANISM="Scrippsiella trochoidea, Strain CCMP3099" /LENGTH=130 /DNA_ID=CAMNT_0002714733 /DNA_START=405 /DNA_END=798 /DNA_ORIENTATION=-